MKYKRTVKITLNNMQDICQKVKYQLGSRTSLVPCNLSSKNYLNS